ncbi:hypothetical protein [Flavivirga eckloniae]|uniref:Tetratricopeptide repeat protein n=1 Tax=Flavivirga eckloniae TaxID=1803846 RepID=A0A2K9PPP7_9FLAO|nr:hypothetical protein [Flavivirga eckloniae]AUP79060.1 hypothetical protein C1H87_10260 [Flavivirga eckloniae]
MEITEIVLLILGGITLIFSLVMIFIHIKKDQSYMKISWLVIIAFLMMGFPLISKAKILGLEYSKEKDLEYIKTMAEALAECPDNDVLKKELEKSLDKIEQEQPELKSGELAGLSEAYLVKGDTEKAKTLSDSAIKTDPTNSKAVAVKEMVKTQISINELPKSVNTETQIRKARSSINKLRTDPNTNKAVLYNMDKLLTVQDSLRKIK